MAVYSRTLSAMIPLRTRFTARFGEIVLRVPPHPEEDLWFDVISSARGIGVSIVEYIVLDNSGRH